MQQSGQVAVVTKNRYGYGMKIEGNDNWFNSKTEINASKGDMVTFDDGGKNYINGLTGGGSAPANSGGSSGGSSSGGHDKRQTSIVRQNAVTNANAFFQNTGNKKYNLGDLLKAAQYITLYTEGNPMPPTAAEAEKAAADKAEEEARTADEAAIAAAAAEADAAATAPSQDDINSAMAAMDEVPTF